MKIPLLIVFEKAIGRNCGSCKACCTTHEVKELKKSGYTNCIHECENGCSIHGEHPKSCKEYACLWKLGMIEGDERRRPDNFGILIDTNTDNEDILVVWETRENGLNNDSVKHFLKRIATKHGLFIKYFNSEKRIILGPPIFLDKYKDAIKHYGVSTTL